MPEGGHPLAEQLQLRHLLAERPDEDPSRSGLARLPLADPPVRRIAAARLAASFRSAATASMLDVLKETARHEGFVSRAG